MTTTAPPETVRARKQDLRPVRGLRVNVDGTLEDVQVEAAPGYGHVAGLNEAIGSNLFDVVGLPDGIDVFVDDEGLYRQEHNPVLSDMVAHLTGRTGVHLNGPGVFLAVNDDGDTIALTPAQRATVATAWFGSAPLAAL